MPGTLHGGLHAQLTTPHHHRPPNSNEDIGDKEAQRIVGRVPKGTQTVVRRFEETALPHVDQMEAYADWLDEQLQRAEGKMRPV
jgi:hypothetical protein